MTSATFVWTATCRPVFPEGTASEESRQTQDPNLSIDSEGICGCQGPVMGSVMLGMPLEGFQ